MKGTIGDRLREAIEAMPREGKQKGIRLFARRIQEAYPNVTGISYPSIHSYLADRTEPSEEFLEAAAELLMVSVEWLKGESEMMRPGVGEVSADQKASSSTVKGVYEAFDEGWPPWRDLPDGLDSYFLSLAVDAAVARSRSEGRNSLTREDFIEASRQLGDLIFHPFDFWAWPNGLRFGGRKFKQYAQAMLLAASLAFNVDQED